MTPSIRTALETLKLERVDVIHGGDDTFPLAEKVRAVALRRVVADIARLGDD